MTEPHMQGLLISSGEIRYNPFKDEIEHSRNTLAESGIWLQAVLWHEVANLSRSQFGQLLERHPQCLALVVDASFTLNNPLAGSSFHKVVPQLRRNPDLQTIPILGLCSSDITGYHAPDQYTAVARLVEAPQSVVTAAMRINLLQSIRTSLP